MAKVDRNKILATAQKLIQRGDLAKAVDQYETLIEAQPKDVQSLLRLAGLYIRIDKKDEAVKAYMNAGGQYADTGFYQKAVAAYKQALQLKDNDATLFHQLGDLYQQMGLKSPAVEHFIQAANLYAGKNDYDHAVEVMLGVMDLEPDRPDLKARYGEYLFQAGRQDEAIAVFRGLVEILKLEGQWEDLARFYERILQMSPEDHEIGLDLARTYLRLGLAPKALQRLKNLFDDGARNAEVFDLLARAYVLLGKNGKAVSAYLEKVRRLDRGKQADEIQKTYRRILEIDPTNEHALAALGEAEEEAEAVAVTEEEDDGTDSVVEVVALEEEEEVPAASQGTGGEFSEMLQEASVYLRYGIKEKALKKLDTVLAQDPTNVAALKKRIDVNKEADASKAVPDLVRLSEIYEGLGDLDAADKCIEEAKLIDADHPALREFLGLEGGGEEAEESSPVAEVVSDEEDSAEASPEADDFLADATLAGEEEADELGEDFLDLGDLGGGDAASAADDEATQVESAAGDDLEVEVELEAEAAEAEVELEPEPAEEELPYQDEIEQVQFFLDTGLEDEARKLLAELEAQYGEQAEFTELRGKLPQPEEVTAKPAEPAVEAEPSGTGGIFDLAAELEEELDFADIEESSPGAEDVPSFDEIFDAFKKGVKEQLGEEDADAHYDLGIAYMEMGIIDEAVSEFELAKQSPAKAAEACNMIGVALSRKGDLEGAVAAYEEGLGLDDLPEPIMLNMNYEVALLLEELGKLKAALQHLKVVLATDKSYRDVGELLQRIKQRIEAIKSGAASGGESPEKSNVTYL